MILRILFALFPQLRDDRVQLKDCEMRLRVLELENERLRTENDSLRLRAENAEKRTDAVLDQLAAKNAELIDRLSNAGDSLAMRLTGRRLFSKAPVEVPPPAAAPRQMHGKMFAGDLARIKNADFFKRLAAQSGVAPEPEYDPEPKKPN